MWEQLVTPNFPGRGTVGNCLVYGRERFGIDALYKSAWLAWVNSAYKHTDRNFPDVCVPVFFSHYGTYGSPPKYDNWGHEVTWNPADRKFYSSPYSNAAEYNEFNSIEEIEQKYNAVFVGWTEDLNGVRVAQEDSVEVFKDTNDVRVNGWLLYGYDKPGSSPEVMVWVGKPKLEFFDGLGPTVVNDMNALRKQIADLEQQVSAKYVQVPTYVRADEVDNNKKKG